MNPEENQSENLQKLPGNILSMICGYLGHSQIGKLSQSSLYFNLATHMHYKRRFKTEMGEETEDTLTPLLRASPQPLTLDRKKSNTNWKIEYAKKKSQKLFSVNMLNMKMDPYVQGGVYGDLPDLTHVLKHFDPIDVK